MTASCQSKEESVCTAGCILKQFKCSILFKGAVAVPYQEFNLQPWATFPKLYTDASYEAKGFWHVTKTWHLSFIVLSFHVKLAINLQ